MSDLNDAYRKAQRAECERRGLTAYDFTIEIANELREVGLKAVAAHALRDAARAIPEQMRQDELDMHLLTQVDLLPYLPRVMLNGATRFAERLQALADATVSETEQKQE